MPGPRHDPDRLAGNAYPEAPVKVLTIGTFDVLHFGHVGFLLTCRKLAGDSGLVVGVNTDRFAASFKRPPVMTQHERGHALAQLGFAVAFNDGPGSALISEIKPDLLAIGSDWARKDYLAQIGVTQDWVDEHQITLSYVPYVQQMAMSTSEIRRRVLEAG